MSSTFHCHFFVQRNRGVRKRAERDDGPTDIHEALDNALALVDVAAIYHRGARSEAAREHGPACFRQRQRLV